MNLKTNILIVGKNKPFCDSFKDDIENSGYSTRIALCGREAIEQHKKNRYNMVFIDDMLPDMSSHEVVNEMIEICSSTEYIYVTSCASVDSAIGAVGQTNVLSYETKPLDTVHILQTIQLSIERRQIEKILKEAESKIHKLSRAVEQSPMTVIITNLESKVEYVNSKFTQLSGYTREDIIGENPSILQSGKTSPEVYKSLWRTITSGKEWRGEFCNKKQNGEHYLEFAIISPLKDENGHISHYIAFKENITEKRRIEEALIQPEKMKFLSTITAGVSHVFNNIFQKISGIVELLEANHKDKTELVGELSTIMEAIDDGTVITNKMLKITESSINISEFLPSNINELLKQSKEFTMIRLKKMAQASGANYFIDHKEMGNDSQLLCNPNEIRDVFISIINNALDAMPDGGSISLGTWSNEDILFVSISDTGKGMTQETKDRIFDPFFTTKRPKGIGLDMSIAYSIINRYGGKIEVKSELGKGTTFTLQFPTTNVRRSQLETPILKQETNVKCLRILVVDDEDAICRTLDQLLTRFGHKVKTVNNGVDAINAIKSESFDLALCDLAMPNVLEFEVIKAINGLEKRPKIGIITGCGEKINTIGEEGVDVDFIIKKPFRFPEITKHINDAFDADSK